MSHFAHQFRRSPLRTLGLCAALTSLGLSSVGCGKEEEPDYGSVRIKFRVGPGVDADELFEQTKTLRILAPYNSCVRKYYEGEGADKLFVTPEGEEVMEEWKQRLCAKSDPTDTGRAAKNFLECDPDTVTLTQKIERQEQPHLEIKIVLGSADEARDLAQQNVRIGPLPTERLTGCKSAFIFQSNGISGLSKQGYPVWKAVSEEAGTENRTPSSTQAYTVTVGSSDGKL